MAIIELASTDNLRLANLILGLAFGTFQLLLLMRRCSQMHSVNQKDSVNRKEGKCPVLTISGVAVIVFGIVTCTFIVVANCRDLRHFSELERICQLGMKLATVTYCGLRFSVYIFLIYRIDLVKMRPTAGSSTFTQILKFALIVCYISGVGIALVFTQGNLEEGEVVSCRGRFNPVPLFLAALVDFSICFIALMWFLRPLKNISDSFTASDDMLGDKVVLRIIKKMRFYGYIMILSSVLAICLAGIFGGLSLIYAVDAGVTSCALVLIYEPNDHFFGVHQVTLSVIRTTDLRELTEEFKCASRASTDKTFSSTDLESISSLVPKASAQGNSGASSIFKDTAGNMAREYFNRELADRFVVEWNIEDEEDHKTEEKKQDLSSTLDKLGCVLDLEKDDSLELVVKKGDSLILVKENLERPEWLVV